MAPLHLGPRILAVGLLVSAYGPHGRGLPDLDVFDSIITPELIAAGYREKVPLTFGVVDQDSTRVFWSNFEFQRLDPAEHYTCAVTAAKSGRRDLQQLAGS